MEHTSSAAGERADLTAWLAKREDTAQAPRVAVGTMNFGKRTDAQESERIIHASIDRGLNLFDTANAYNAGESERITGRALKDRRASCLIATKVGLARVGERAEGLSRATVVAAAEASLERLGTDWIDLYYLHAPDHATPIEETLEAMATLLAQGKVRAWGVSNYAAWQVLEMNHLCDARAMARPVASQVIYNVLIRDLDVEYLAYARRYPIHTTVYNPLAGGLLARRIEAAVEVPAGSRFDNNAFYQRRYLTDAMVARAGDLQAIAEREGLSLLELAYAWVAGRRGVDSVLVGPASVAHLDAALAGLSARLAPEVMTELDAHDRGWRGTDTRYVR